MNYRMLKKIIPLQYWALSLLLVRRKIRFRLMSNCSAIISSSIFNRLLAYASEEVATQRILWMGRWEVEGIAVIHCVK